MHGHGLRFVLDIVPNHVGVDVPRANPWWWDVLRLGRESAYAGYFDIDWSAGPILLPILDADEEKALSELGLSEDRTELRYYEHAFPVAPGTADSGTAAEVHQRQHYRLASWKRGAAELTYRRFFDVSTLAAVRVEIPEVFDATHRELLRWVAEDGVDGLRVDHPDGLSDPGGYVRRLRAAIGPDRWLVVEKILGVGEALPASWPVDGTSGYEALREIQGVFVDPDGAGLLTQFAAEHTGRKESLHEAEHAARLEVARTILAAEVGRIRREWAAAPEAGAAPTDDAVAELLCAFPVYRSYLPEGRDSLDTALSVARIRRPDLADQLAGLHAAMLADPHGALATRIQQTSGMVMAKGVEDTTYYRWNRFVALNEVGGDPSRFGVSAPEFHAAMADREAGWPATMTTLSTHDTKRSEDVRARLAVLAEIPAEWTGVLRRWAAAHPLPDRSLELLAWQCLVGAWPIPADRLAGYLGKAAKEAKLVTSHVDAVPEVDAAIAEWPEQVLADAELVAEIERFVERIAGPGRSNSLGQKLLQLAGPGVPDVYQGTELFEYSLVDPDNRRPVDWDAAARAAGPARRRLAARRRRRGRGQAAGHRERAAAAPVPPGGVHRLPAAARLRSGGRPRRRVPALPRPGRGGHPAAGRAGRGRRLARHRAAAAGRGRGLVGRDHRRRYRPLPAAGPAPPTWSPSSAPRPGRGGHPAPGRAGRGGRLAGHRAAAAGRGRRLVGRHHRGAGREPAPAGRPAEPLSGGVAGPSGITRRKSVDQMFPDRDMASSVRSP